MRRRILVVDDVVPDPRFGYGYARSLDVLRELRYANCAVTLIPLGPREPEDENRVREMGVDVMPDDGAPEASLAALISPGLDHWDAVWASRPKNLRVVLRALAKCRRRPALVYDAEALNWLRTIAMHEVTGNVLPADRHQIVIGDELSLIRQADVVISVSARERRILQAQAIRVVVEAGHAHAAAPTTMPFDERRDILFVGGFFGLRSGMSKALSPNEDALQYFLDQVWPLLHDKIDCRLVVVGYGSELLGPLLDMVRSPQIHFAGTVDSLRPYYERARVAVVPTRFAAGIPWKATEALSHGVPVVATPLIHDQFPAERNPLLVGATAQEFADSVMRICRDRLLWERQRAQGLDYIEANFNEARFRSGIRSALAAIPAVLAAELA